MKESDLLRHLKKNPFLLAPMAGITDRPFRSFMREMGCGIVISELVSATGLKFSGLRTRRLMEFNEDQRPVGIQLFGEELEHLSYAAKVVEDAGADFVDLNFGCPVPKVVKKGAGSAVLKDLAHMREILRTVRKSVSIPVTIKVRTGWEFGARNTHQVVQLAADLGVTWVAIHGRTRAQGYSGRADWDYIAEVKSMSPVPVIGNGDLTSAQLAVSRLRQSGCDGVMIGRGCLKNPWIFQEALKIWHGSSAAIGPKQFPVVFERLMSHLGNFVDGRLFAIQLKKFAAWYSSGYPGSGQFRKSLFQCQSKDELLALMDEFFCPLIDVPQVDTSQEAFLMGGHG